SSGRGSGRSFAVSRAVRGRSRTGRPRALRRTTPGAGGTKAQGGAIENGMKGVILAAVKGSRLNGTAGDKPKCLVEAGGMTLIERQISTLRHAGIDDIVVVVGCQAERVRAACGPGVTYVENSRFA